MPKFVFADCPFCSVPYQAEEGGYDGFEKCNVCGGALKVGDTYVEDTTARVQITHARLLPNLSGETFEKDGYVVKQGTLVSAPPSLTELQIPNGVLAIGAKVFQNYRSLKNIRIPDGVLYIGASAFAGCDGAKTLRLPKTLIAMGNNAFRGCRRLTEVQIPESLQSAGYAVFQECDNLLVADFPMDMTYLGGSPYRYCKNLKRATIPHCVKETQTWFTDVVALEALTVGRNATKVPLEFFGKLKAVYFTRTENWRLYSGWNKWEDVPEHELADPKKAAQFLYRAHKRKVTLSTPTDCMWHSVFLTPEK